MKREVCSVYCVVCAVCCVVCTVYCVEDDQKLPAAAVREQVWQDYCALVRRLRRMAKRRSCPPWGVSAEVALQLLELARVHRSVLRRGVGYEAYSRHTQFRLRFLDLLEMVRRTGCMPLSWVRGEGFGLAKNNGKQGVLGMRLVHSFDHIGQSWRGGALRRGPQPTPPPWAHGGLAHRSFESAVIVMGVQAWHQAQYGRSQVTMLYDSTNAFGCLSAEDHDEAVGRLFGPTDAEYEKDFHKQQLVSIGTMEGYVEVKVGEGTLMGSSAAPAKFVNAYDQRLLAWERDLLRHDRVCLDTTAIHPVAARKVQLGLTTFVDNIARAFVFSHNDADRMAEQVNEGTEQLAQHLGRGGIALNRGKTQVVLTLRGVGAHGVVSAFCMRPLIEGCVDKEGRHLGPIVDLSKCPATEVSARVRAGRQSGVFWGAHGSSHLVTERIVRSTWPSCRARS